MKLAGLISCRFRDAARCLVIALIVGGAGCQPCKAELLFVSATRWIQTLSGIEFVQVGGGSESTRYGQSLWLFFSKINDATWAEVVMPDGSTNQLAPMSPASYRFPGAESAFSLGGSTTSLLELNSYSPSGATYLVRFGGGTLGVKSGSFFIPADTAFFANPPSNQFSDEVKLKLSSYDSASPVALNVAGEFSIVYEGTNTSSELFSGTNQATIPANTLQPGVLYCADKDVFGTVITNNTFGGMSRSNTNAPIFGYYLTSWHRYYFQTRPPQLRLTFKGQPAFDSVAQKTSMLVQLASNPRYDADIEFTETLQSFPSWAQTSASFGTNGITSLILQKSGDVRTNWSKQLFFRVKNRLSPLQAAPNPVISTPSPGLTTPI